MADENETERDEEDKDDAPAAAPEASTREEEDDRDDDGDDDEDTSEASSAPAGSDDDAKRVRDEERELQRDEEQQAREQENLRDDELPIAGLLGLERWVQFAFVSVAVFLVFVTDKLVTFGWEFYAEPDDTIVTIVAVAVGLVGTYLAYQNDRVRDFATEVVTELSKVTWPTREETWYSTIVVLSASAIAAVYTGVFDALWSALTDLVYRV
jgi:preprotein translocase subunit SecE